MLTAAILVVLTSSNVAWAGGDKNAHNNPNGNPAEDTFQTPYANTGDGRMMIFCAENEMLVVTPIEPGALEVICIPTTE